MTIARDSIAVARKSDLLDASRNDSGNDGDEEDVDEMVCRWHERMICMMQLEMMTGMMNGNERDEMNGNERAEKEKER